MCPQRMEFNLATALTDATTDTGCTKSDYKSFFSDSEKKRKVVLTLEKSLLGIDVSLDT